MAITGCHLLKVTQDIQRVHQGLAFRTVAGPLPVLGSIKNPPKFCVTQATGAGNKPEFTCLIVGKVRANE
jgi:hypothetical protein